MQISNDIKYIGVNDNKIDLFEAQFPTPNGMSYNSYIILDEKIAVLDSVEEDFGDLWISNIKGELNGKIPDYLIVHHMEPDHSSNIFRFIKEFPTAKIVSSKKAFNMMNNFFKTDFSENQIIVGEGDTLNLGRHTLTFFTAPMVHWPEVLVSYETHSKTLFSADAFGKFGANKTQSEEWLPEARRYYFGIVAKYGAQVQNLLLKIKPLNIQNICPLHGPILSGNIKYYLNYYNIWSKYLPEQEAVLIAYTSVYGHTKKAVDILAEKLKSKGVNVITLNLTRCDMSNAVATAFWASKLVLATTTYNGKIFPQMNEFITHLTERNFQNRTLAIIENGSWAPNVLKTIKLALNNLNFANNNVTIISSISAENLAQIEELSNELCI